MKAGSRPQYYRIRRMVQMVREGTETGYLPNSSECLDGIAKELENRTPLRLTGTDSRPDALGPVATFLASSALSNAAVDNEIANGLFGHVVGRLNAGCGDEGEELLGVHLETLAQVASTGTVGGRPEFFDEFITPFDQHPLEIGLSEFLFSVDQAEQFPEQLQDFLRPVARHLIGGLGQEFNISNEMGQTELHHR